MDLLMYDLVIHHLKLFTPPHDLIIRGTPTAKYTLNQNPLGVPSFFKDVINCQNVRIAIKLRK